MRIMILYAGAGLWYDALAALSMLIDAAPPGTPWRQQWAALLAQEQLAAVAADDRQRLGASKRVTRPCWGSNRLRQCKTR
jgi:Domain of Unknown Function (DUF928)